MKRIAAGLLMSLAFGSAWSDIVQRGDFLHAPDRVAWQAGGLYDGRFDDGTRFQIELAYPRPAGLPERVTPFNESYWYPKHTTGEAFHLRDADSSGNTLRLALESDTDKSAEENFAIALTADKLTGSGTWNSSRLHKQMRFTLQRAIVYDGVVVTRPAPPEARADDPNRPFLFTAYFPVLGNMAADAWIAKQAAACSDDLECVNDVRVRWKSASLLSLEANKWGYSYSAAHGNGGSTTRQYRIAAKGFTPLGLGDFVKLDASCDAKMRTAMAVQLRAKGFPQGADAIQESPLAPDTTLKFTPTASGIAFHFDPYEVGSYAQGAPSIFLTRAQLGACVRELPADD
jgi:hypothetical protein